jgi:hypothetical protein
MKLIITLNLPDEYDYGDPRRRLQGALNDPERWAKIAKDRGALAATLRGHFVINSVKADVVEVELDGTIQVDLTDNL